MELIPLPARQPASWAVQGRKLRPGRGCILRALRQEGAGPAGVLQGLPGAAAGAGRRWLCPGPLCAPPSRTASVNTGPAAQRKGRAGGCGLRINPSRAGAGGIQTRSWGGGPLLVITGTSHIQGPLPTVWSERSSPTRFIDPSTPAGAPPPPCPHHPAVGPRAPRPRAHSSRPRLGLVSWRSGSTVSRPWVWVRRGLHGTVRVGVQLSHPRQAGLPWRAGSDKLLCNPQNPAPSAPFPCHLLGPSPSVTGRLWG